MAEPRISAIDLAGRSAVLDDGRILPITNMFDDLRDETDDPAEAVTFVCGAGDLWISDWVENFGGAVH